MGVLTVKGIILAAGRGSRMGSATRDRPKCLAEVAGRTLLEWQIGALERAGIGPIAVVTGYQAKRLASNRYEIFTNPRWASTNMVASLATAAPWLEESDCLVSYGDILYHPDVVTQLYRSEGEIALVYDRLWEVLWSRRFTNPLDDAETFAADDRGLLLDIGRRARSTEEIQGQYMGLLKFTPTGWSQVTAALEALPPEQQDSMDVTTMLGHLISTETPIRTTAVDGRWCETDSASDLALYERLAAQDIPWAHDWRW